MSSGRAPALGLAETESGECAHSSRSTLARLGEPEMRSKLYPGRAARPMATTTVAALLAGIVISGCGTSAPSPATPPTGTTTRTTAPASLPAPAASGVAGQLYEGPVS